MLYAHFFKKFSKKFSEFLDAIKQQVLSDLEYQKTFLGACLDNTPYTENNKTVTTGFAHIKELGVNAVQLLPIFDQDNDEKTMKFNWGYNPLNYNSLEGSYSTNPYDGYTRIKEFKTLVKEYNKAGIGIIMDVVYNHVSNLAKSNFNYLMPKYYYRYNGISYLLESVMLNNLNIVLLFY